MLILFVIFYCSVNIIGTPKFSYYHSFQRNSRAPFRQIKPKITPTIVDQENLVRAKY